MAEESPALGARLTGLNAFPEALMVQTTTRCNAACSFCPYPAVHRDFGQGEMKFSIFAKLMRECSRYPVKAISLFLMNEPLMDPDIIDRINFAVALNPRAGVSIWTNGCQLDEELCRALIASRLHAIGISIHAMWPETYRQLTGRRGLEKIIESVIRLIELRDLYRPRFKIELRLVGQDQFLSREEVQEAVGFWGRYGLTGLDRFVGHTTRAGNLPGTYQVLHRSLRGCGAGLPYRMATVLYNGDVVLCCMDWRREVILGNVQHSSLASVWRSDQRRLTLDLIDGRASAPRDFICARCIEAFSGERSEQRWPVARAIAGVTALQQEAVSAAAGPETPPTI